MTMGVADGCQICLGSFNAKDNEDLRCDNKKVVLPCHESHVFGRECLAKWFDQSKTCPSCRFAVPSYILESLPPPRSLRERVIRKLSQIATNAFIGAVGSALIAATVIGTSGIINIRTGLAGTDDVVTALAAGVGTATVSGAVFGAGNSVAELQPYGFTGSVIGFACGFIAFLIDGYLPASHFAGFTAGAFVGGVWPPPSINFDD
ncbi:RING finger domain-containing protein [Endozoicomonas sp. ONNA2]|uniref:RING finger domain-containing protein n=1 Tax=Endozoicomonas sp. ONNA2 TaxID=2828741 RepID=UPI002148CB16|nr:RING finger domain-containing protein [Endozoicomonas sp. ONNA2]